MHTIKSVLSRVLSGDLQTNAKPNEATDQYLAPLPTELLPWGEDSWDLDIDFWRNLATHPMLAGTEPTLDGLL